MDAYHAVFCIGLVIMTHNTPWLLSTSSPITNLTTHHHPPLGVGATYGVCSHRGKQGVPEYTTFSDFSRIQNLIPESLYTIYVP